MKKETVGRTFEQTELTKMLLEALSMASGYAQLLGENKVSDKFELIKSRIEQDHLDVSFTSREL